MAPPDSSIDYYAELGISANAGEDEINKAYKKLALKYHPDRNHGNEEEVAPKFQRVSEAHDTLRDPDLRRKYDLARKRGEPIASGFASSTRPSARGSANPYRATSQFDPPPRPPGFTPRARTSGDPRPGAGPSAGPSGANRYTSRDWQPPQPRPAQNTSAKQSRANVFNAWQKMNNAQQASPQRPAYNVPPAWEGNRSGDDSSRPASGRSAYEEVRYSRPPPSRNASARVPPRRGGFDPSTPDQDEPPAPTSAYSREYSRPPDVPPRAAPTAQRRPTNPRGDSNSHYAGEDTYLDNLRRSASMRDATQMHANRPPVQPKTGRPRSHSPRRNEPGSSTPFDTGTRSQRRHYHSVSSRKPFIVHQSSEEDPSSDEPSSESVGEDDDGATPQRRASLASGPSQQVNPSTRAKAKPSAAWNSRRDPLLGKSKSYEEEQRSGDSSVSAGQKLGQDPNISPHRANPSHANGSVAAHDQGQEPEKLSGETQSRPLSSRGEPFSAENWKSQFQETNWAANWAHPAASGSANVSPTRANAIPNSKRTRPGSSKAPPQPPPRANAQPVTVEDIPEHLEQGDLPAAAAAAAASATSSANGIAPEPMDIDEDNPRVDSHHPRPNSDLPSEGRAAPFSSRPNLNLNDFRHVEPFSQNSGGGLSDLNNLQTELPFDSQASARHPSKTARAMPEMPKPPVAPLPPSHITQHHWDAYLSQMRDYMWKWHVFNHKMVVHFQERVLELDQSDHGPGVGWIDGWLGIVGETGELKGWDSYVQGLQADQRWRHAWTEACERHGEAIERHERIRRQMLRSG